MKLIESVINQKKVLRYRNNNGKIDYLDFDTINDMIKDITTGPLGMGVVKENHKALYDEIDKKYVYEDEHIGFEYYKEKRKTGYDPFEYYYMVYYGGTQVYPNMKLWENNWINLLLSVYDRHLKIIQESKQQQEAKKLAEEKKQRVLRVFGFSYPNGYADENITVSDIHVGQSYSSFPDNEIYYNYIGKITLNDGTVVCDVKNNIYIPGPWEEYVCLVVTKMQERVAAEQKKKFDEAQLIRERLRNKKNNNN